MSLLEAAILGSIFGAVSPAVVVPLMIDFMDRGRGVKKGIPTLVLAVSSVDDVFVIVLFTIFLGMYGGGQINVWLKLGEVPVSIGGLDTESSRSWLSSYRRKTVNLSARQRAQLIEKNKNQRKEEKAFCMRKIEENKPDL
jgi:hypothetical protein